MSFRTLTGNPSLVGRLERLARAGSVPPSLLFAGPAGVGKLDAALALAMALQCETEPGVGCGSCSVCARIAREEHPDVHVYRPEGAGRQIKKDAVEQIVGEAPSHPFEGRFRVSILADCERMNDTAANKLLKTLEEPPPWVVLMLLTSNTAGLLPTIRSRCQVYRFAPLDVETVERLLVEQHDVEPDKATLLAALSGGSVTEALELDGEAMSALRDEALELAGLVTKGASEHELVTRADRLAKTDTLLPLLRLLAGLCRDVASRAAGGPVVHRDLEETLSELASRAPLPSWIEAHEESTNAHLDLRDRYLNKRITVGRLLKSLNVLSRLNRAS